MDSVPDQLEPLTGYRSWRVGLDAANKPMLWSMYQGYEWKPPMITAECVNRSTWRLPFARYKPHDEPAPVAICTCGVYAMNSPNPPDHPTSLAHLIVSSQPGTKVRPAWPDEMATRTTSTMFFVRGQVAGWGHFIEGEYGWRAQYAKPTALLAHLYRRLVSDSEEAMWQVLESIATTWSIPLVTELA